MLEEENVQLKVRISREVSRRLKQYVSSKYPDLFRGPLSEEVEKALVQYLNSKEHNNNKNIQNTHEHNKQYYQHHPNQQQIQQLHHHQHQQHQQNKEQQQSSRNTTNNTKYQRLIDTIKRYSNSQRQISPGLVRKAIKEVIGKDERTIVKYLKILQEDDILYGDSLGGKYYIQVWVFGDYIKLAKEKKEDLQTQATVTNSWSKI